MDNRSPLGPSVSIDAVRVDEGRLEPQTVSVAVEVPCTIRANDVELVTLSCSPADLRELAVGFLHSTGLIRSAADVRDLHVDEKRYEVTATLTRTPAPGETSAPGPIASDLTVCADRIAALAGWLQHCSALYRETGAVHTAAISEAGAAPDRGYDDIGRHNAVDKAIGGWLLAQRDFGRGVLVSSGRTSTEILHKAHMAGIALTVARGAPTHQAVLTAREMNLTVVGFARGGGFTVYAGESRVTLDRSPQPE